MLYTKNLGGVTSWDTSNYFLLNKNFLWIFEWQKCSHLKVEDMFLSLPLTADLGEYSLQFGRDNKQDSVNFPYIKTMVRLINTNDFIMYESIAIFVNHNKDLCPF